MLIGNVSLAVCGMLTDTTDVVDAVLYLLSDSAAMINGVTLPVDGGYLAS